VADPPAVPFLLQHVHHRQISVGIEAVRGLGDVVQEVEIEIVDPAAAQLVLKDRPG